MKQKITGGLFLLLFGASLLCGCDTSDRYNKCSSFSKHLKAKELKEPTHARV